MLATTTLIKSPKDTFFCLKYLLGSPDCQTPPPAFAPSCYVIDSMAEGMRRSTRSVIIPDVEPKEARDHWSLQSTRTSVPGLIHDLIGAWE